MTNEIDAEPDPRTPSGRQVRPAGSLPMIFGHRGMSKRAPENTLAAFALIADNGIPAVELDIHQCASGELVVAHDDTLARTTGADLNLRHATLGQIREHEVGSWFDIRFTGEKVPTLAQLFELLGDRVLYDIEIKTYGSLWGTPVQDNPEATLVALIRQYGLTGRCIVSSFDPLILRRFSRLTKEIPIALIYSNSPKVPVTIRRGRGRLFCSPDIMKPEYTIVTAGYVRRHHARGRQVIPWTVDDPEEARRLTGLGVDGVITNVPDVIRSALQ